MHNISVVIPVFNEEDSLPELFKRLSILNDSRPDKYRFEFLLVNDGSSDNSLNLILHQAEEHSSFKVLSFSRNFGHQAALLAGITYAKGDAVVAMDADLQDPPEIIHELIAQWEAG
jgi:dolichol-phosphate mannosyltransferase